jgi:hypothetical protein
MLGVVAGVGIALKPYFVTLWFALEGWLLLSGRVRRPRDQPEAIAVVAVGLLYLAAVAVLTPEYFALARSMGSAYFGYLSNGVLVTILTGDGAGVGLFALLAYVALRRTARRRELWAGLAVAVVGFWVSAMLQHKGWRYHFYPSLALAWC